MDKSFIQFMEQYKNEKIALAVSGGVDSITLLYWTHLLKMNFIILHVNHKLRDEADEEEKALIKLANKLNVPIKTFQWNEKHIGNTELTAREARYKFMLDYCKDNNIKILATAHQANDQIETFLMNLSRGSGVIGLSGIQEKSIKNDILIIRPLLNIKRQVLINYCKQHNISYFIDSMNSDPKYYRVKIRQNRSVLQTELGITDERILLAIKNLNRTRSFIEDYISKKLKSLDNIFQFPTSFLFDESDEIALRLLSSLIQKVGNKKYQPRLLSLQNVLKTLINKDKTKITLSGCIIERKKTKILIKKEN